MRISQSMWTTTVANLKSSFEESSGATAIEYALIGAGIAIAIVAAVFALGDEIVSLFGTAQSALNESR